MIDSNCRLREIGTSGKLKPKPTTAKPGTIRKVAVLRGRARRMESLWDELDARDSDLDRGYRCDFVVFVGMQGKHGQRKKEKREYISKLAPRIARIARDPFRQLRKVS